MLVIYVNVAALKMAATTIHSGFWDDQRLFSRPPLERLFMMFDIQASRQFCMLHHRHCYWLIAVHWCTRWPQNKRALVPSCAWQCYRTTCCKAQYTVSKRSFPLSSFITLTRCVNPLSRNFWQTYRKTSNRSRVSISRVFNWSRVPPYDAIIDVIASAISEE